MFLLILLSHLNLKSSMVTSKDETKTTEIVQIGKAWTLVFLLSWYQVSRLIGGNRRLEAEPLGRAREPLLCLVPDVYSALILLSPEESTTGPPAPHPGGCQLSMPKSTGHRINPKFVAPLQNMHCWTAAGSWRQLSNVKEYGKFITYAITQVQILAFPHTS